MTWFRVRTAGVLAVLAAAASLYAADLPWVGQWKINVAKSNFGEWTFTFAALGPGEMQWTEDGKTTRFKMDGKHYPVPGAEPPLGADRRATWETVYKVKDTVVSSDVTRLSAGRRQHSDRHVEGHPTERQGLRERVRLRPSVRGTGSAREVEVRKGDL